MLSVAGMFGQICETISDMELLRVKIIDLGTVQHFKDGDFRNQVRVGKLCYMAPEVPACGCITKN